MLSLFLLHSDGKKGKKKVASHSSSGVLGFEQQGEQGCRCGQSKED